MAKIKGITVVLHDVAITGEDPFGDPIEEEIEEVVDNVLVAPASSQEILDTVNLYGKKAVYTLAIPKGDMHDWKDKQVTFFGQDFKTFGIPLEGIECDIPLMWNKKVTVEKYE